MLSFCLAFSFAKEKVSYLLASSIATATATVILNLRVITCTDETHHLYVFRKLLNILNNEKALTTVYAYGIMSQNS